MHTHSNSALGQLVTVLVEMAQIREALLEAGNPEIASHLHIRIGQTTRQALREMRFFIHELRPRILEQNGLAAQGLSIPAIAAELGTDPDSINQFFSSIFHKLYLADRAKTAMYVLQEGHLGS